MAHYPIWIRKQTPVHVHGVTYLSDTTGQLGDLDLLLGEVPLETGEDYLPLAGLKPVYQTK